jgi:alanine-glyoxylate transaminase/serine-glyoxylate transaminase/serine-pyruvate transaminase
MGLECHVAYEHRLPTLTTIKVPPGVDAKKAVGYILDKYQIEIGNGLGDLAGKVWRIGLMGVNARHDVALTVTSVLKDALRQQGYKC